MGSAVLPLAGAVASTGIIVGIGTALLVSVMNVYTSRMLLDQARATGAHDYESLGCLVSVSFNIVPNLAALAIRERATVLLLTVSRHPVASLTDLLVPPPPLFSAGGRTLVAEICGGV